eukprot:10185884-Alexandrium_andersonii.AAC.1
MPSIDVAIRTGQLHDLLATEQLTGAVGGLDTCVAHGSKKACRRDYIISNTQALKWATRASADFTQ